METETDTRVVAEEPVEPRADLDGAGAPDASPEPSAPATERADDQERADHQDASTPGSAVLPWVRPVAVLALVAALGGRALGPSLLGSFPGSDRYEFVSYGAALLTQATSLIVAIWVLFGTRALLSRQRLPLAFRFAISSLAGVVLGLSLPAALLPLPSFLGRILALGTAALALLAAARGIRVVATRALAIVAAMLAVAAVIRQIGWGMAVYAGEHALVGVSVASRWVATAGLLVHAVATASALVWLATRRRRLFSPWTTAAMIASVVATRYAEMGQRATSSLTYFIGRSATTLASPIHPIGPTSLRVFLVTMSTLFALVAVCQRRQVAPLVGAFALALLGGVDADIPLAALFTAASALTMVLVGEDKRSLWDAMEASTETPRPAS